MSKKKSQLETGLKKATIELLLLRLLSEDDLYGYQLGQELKRRSSGQYTIMEGSMYPILYRMTERGYVSFYERKVGVRQTRVYYHLEDAGRQYFEALLASYREYTRVIDFLLTSRGGESYEADKGNAALSESDQAADSV